MVLHGEALLSIFLSNALSHGKHLCMRSNLARQVPLNDLLEGFLHCSEIVRHSVSVSLLHNGGLNPHIQTLVVGDCADLGHLLGRCGDLHVHLLFLGGHYDTSMDVCSHTCKYTSILV